MLAEAPCQTTAPCLTSPLAASGCMRRRMAGEWVRPSTVATFVITKVRTGSPPALRGAASCWISSTLCSLCRGQGKERLGNAG